MKSVLVGYDGSDQGRDALALAETLRAPDDGQLIVAVVDEVEPIRGDSGELARIRNEYYASTFASAGEELGYTDFEQRVSSGSVAEALYQVAAVNDVDVVVVGSSHRSNLGQVVAGSVADSLLNGLPCPVAVAPNGYAGGDQSKVRLIGVGFDAQKQSTLALHGAIELAREFGADLRLISVAPTHRDLIPGRVGHTSPGYVAALVEYFEELLEEARQQVPADVSAETVILQGDPAMALAEQSEELGLLVLGSRGYGPVRRVLLGSVARKVVKSATCPVVVVPRSAQDKDPDPAAAREAKPAAA
jgi:nucleotide-binding universal stress UspA family protein